MPNAPRRRSGVAVIVLAVLAVLVGVAGSWNAQPTSASIKDAARGGSPGFYWVPPTVWPAPTATGDFDDDELPNLAIEICRLDANGECAGPLVERMTWRERFGFNVLRLQPRTEAYAAEWWTVFDRVAAGEIYRARVLNQGTELGFIDIKVARNLLDYFRIDRSQYIAILRNQTVPLWFRLEKPRAEDSVRINEVESSGGEPGDWVELRNNAASPVAIGGYVIKDNDDTHIYTIPAGTVIAGHGYYVADELALDYGLGGGDSVRFFAPDGTTVIDSYSWAAHAATTYGRCPDGIGDFRTMTSVTKGALNNCSIVVRMNEVESNGGTPGDWVEIYNAGPAEADLEGYVFKDADDSHSFALPAGSLVAPGGYLVLDEAAFGFGLGGADSARLFSPNGALVDAYAWSAHAATTYGRCPNGIGDFATTAVATRGAGNNCGAPPATVKVNEVESNGGVPGDWVEIHNVGATDVDLSGWQFKDNDDTHVYALPGGTVIAAGGFLVLDEAAFGFGLGSGDSARLFAPGDVLVDEYSWTVHASTTYGRCPDGTGAFITTTTATKGGGNDCAPPLAAIKVNEVESNGGSPGDWAEIYNSGSAPVDLTGWKFKDNDDSHAFFEFAAGTVIPAGGFVIIEEAALGYGLGSADSARLFDAGGVLVDSYSWTAHASTTYGRCPDGTGPFTTTTTTTKGAANDCSSPVRINEVESSGDAGDWFELYNAGATPQDISGFVFKDNDDSHAYAFPVGTILGAGAYLSVDEATFGFGLGSADSARLFTGNAALIDTYSWTSQAATTYGRCPDGSGAFATTTLPTKGAANSCPGVITAEAWPGETTTTTVDATATFASNLSGLAYEGSGSAAPGVLWAVRNGPETLFRLLWDGTSWVPDATNDWASGKALRYPGGTGLPDSEGVTFASSPAAGVYVATERDNGASGTSRNSILRFDISAAGATLTATHEWNLTADLPAVGANAGLEAVTWIPDTFLTASGFVDEQTGLPYVPGDYANHGDGLFFIGVEANGMIYAYALDHAGGGYTRVATIESGFPAVMALEFDRELGNLWAVCDDGCQGRSAVLRIDGGAFVVAEVFERPATMPNLNNEGFAVAPLSECSGDLRPAFWSDDADTGGNSLRRGMVTCLPF